jgi:hypothetical protein
VDKLLHRDSSNHPKTHHNTTATTNPDPETQSITGLLPSSTPPPPSTRTLTLPLTGGGTETLIVPNDQVPADPANSDPSHWNFHLNARHASVAASDTGENVTAASDVEKARYAKLMQETKGMNAEQVKEFLKGKGVVDGAKVMRRWEEGKGGEGYMQVVGADRGTF